MYRAAQPERAIVVSEVKPFQTASLKPGDRWLYSAGFNVADLNNTERVDEELGDLSMLVASGCRVSLISHQGSGKTNGSRHLDFLVPYLQEKLGAPVRYVSSMDPQVMRSQSLRTGNGEICLFANTRLFDGEQENSTALAKVFSTLGDQCVVGGFSKLHRQHASNTGILHYLPCYLSTGVQSAIATLAPWSRRQKASLSIAILGGAKVEKLDPGLLGILEFYDYVIPGGAVLNTLLSALGHNIGASTAFLAPAMQKKVAAALERFEEKLLFPQQLRVADTSGTRWEDIHSLALTSEERIVDFALTSQMHHALAQVSADRGRILLAGPPSQNCCGHSHATRAIIERMTDSRANAIVLGGDSVAETQFSGNVSSGGGSALHFIVKGDFGLAYRQIIDGSGCGGSS